MVPAHITVFLSQKASTKNGIVLSGRVLSGSWVQAVGAVVLNEILGVATLVTKGKATALARPPAVLHCKRVQTFTAELCSQHFSAEQRS